MLFLIEWSEIYGNDYMEHLHRLSVTKVFVLVNAVFVFWIMNILLYLLAGAISGFLVNGMLFLWSSLIQEMFLLILVLVLVFCGVIAGCTYMGVLLYQGKHGEFLIWYFINIVSVILGVCIVIVASALELVWHQASLFLLTTALAGAIVGVIQWTYVRSLHRHASVWIIALAGCWLFWGTLALRLLPVIADS